MRGGNSPLEGSNGGSGSLEGSIGFPEDVNHSGVTPPSRRPRGASETVALHQPEIHRQAGGITGRARSPRRMRAGSLRLKVRGLRLAAMLLGLAAPLAGRAQVGGGTEVLEPAAARAIPGGLVGVVLALSTLLARLALGEVDLPGAAEPAITHLLALPERTNSPCEARGRSRVSCGRAWDARCAGVRPLGSCSTRSGRGRWRRGPSRPVRGRGPRAGPGE